MKNVSFRLLVWVFLAMMIGINHSFSQKMPDAANMVYTDFCQSIKNKDLQAYSQLLTVASFTRQKNEALSYGIKFPDELFDMLQASLFELKDMTNIGYKTKGPTTNVFYLYDYKLEKMIVTICLEEHEGKWRMDQMKMRDARDFIKQINEKDYSFIEEKEFQPSGILKPIPTAVEKVDVMAMLDISAYGYKVEVIVNGISQDVVIDKSRSGVLIGGIRRGENKVEMKFEKLKGEESFPPSITIRANVNDVETEVFTFEETPSTNEIIRNFDFK